MIDPKRRLLDIAIEMLIRERAKVMYLCDHLGLTPGDLDSIAVADELSEYDAAARASVPDPIRGHPYPTALIDMSGEELMPTNQLFHEGHP